MSLVIPPMGDTCCCSSSSSSSHSSGPFDCTCPCGPSWRCYTFTIPDPGDGLLPPMLAACAYSTVYLWGTDCVYGACNRPTDPDPELLYTSLPDNEHGCCDENPIGCRSVAHWDLTWNCNQVDSGFVTDCIPPVGTPYWILGWGHGCPGLDVDCNDSSGYSGTLWHGWGYTSTNFTCGLGGTFHQCQPFCGNGLYHFPTTIVLTPC